MVQSQSPFLCCCLRRQSLVQIVGSYLQGLIFSNKQILQTIPPRTDTIRTGGYALWFWALLLQLQAMERALAFFRQNKIAVSIVMGITALAAFIYFRKAQAEAKSQLKAEPSQQNINQQVEEKHLVIRSLIQRPKERKQGSQQLSQIQRKQYSHGSSLVAKRQNLSETGKQEELIHINRNSIKTEQFLQKYADYQCCITLQLIKQPYKLPCGHIFDNVIIEHVERYADCPKCKNQTRLEDLRYSQVTKNEIDQFKKKVGRKGSQWISQRDADIDYSREIQGPR